MTFIKNTKVMLGIIIIISMFSSNASSENFNDSKLTLICNFFSNDKENCYDEVVYLKSKDTKNSIINQCYSKYDSVQKFNDCLKYENNPLIFLKYQNNRGISTRKLFDMKDEIIHACSRIKEKESRFNCVKESYILIEKAKLNENWLENYCLYNNKKLNYFVECIDRIKQDALSDNNLINSLPVLVATLDQWNEKINKRISLYFNQVYQECEIQYSEINAFDCMDGKIGKNIKEMLSFNFTNSTCFKYSKYEDFDECLNIKKNN